MVLELIRKWKAKRDGAIYVAPEIRKRWKKIRNEELARKEKADQLRASCSGYDNPEEYCPRKPKDCVCWLHR